jgi:Outer membrane protein beta-barrel domain
MKKLHWFAFFLLCAPLCAVKAQGLYIGARLLPIFSNFDVSQPNGSTFKTTAVVTLGGGGLIGYNFTNHFALQGEVLYSPLAQKYNDELDHSHTVHLDYLNIPVLAVFNTGVDKPVNLNIALGPQLGINAGSRVDAGSSGDVDTVTAVLKVKPADIGIAYGVGLDFGGVGRITFDVGYRGVVGLVDISDNSNTLETGQYYILQKSHITTHAGYVGVKFKL